MLQEALLIVFKVCRVKKEELGLMCRKGIIMEVYWLGRNRINKLSLIELVCISRILKIIKEIL